MAYNYATRPRTSGRVVPTLIALQTTSIAPTIVFLKCCRRYIYALTLDPSYAYKIPRTDLSIPTIAARRPMF